MRGRIVSKQDVIIHATAGLLAWVMATAYYAAFGGVLLERAFWFYAANAFLVGGGVLFLFRAAIRAARTPERRRPRDAAIFAAPGLVGGGAMLFFLTRLFPHLEPVSVGRYEAFLFVAYAMVAYAAFEPRFKPAATPAR